MKIPPIQPGCPWYDLSQYGLPNVKWCEATRCSIITEPANTWSNLAYIILGFIVLYLIQKRYKKTGRYFGYSLIFVGVSSFIYHMSYTFVFQVLDFVAMYVMTCLMLVMNLNRISPMASKRMLSLFLGGVVVFTGLTLLFYYTNILPIQSLVLLLAIAIASSELYIRFKIKAQVAYKFFFLGLVTIIAAATFSALDVTRTLCMPYHPFIQGHAIWHVLSATGLFFMFFFYRQFEEN